jgi:hypothetical protein
MEPCVVVIRDMQARTPNQVAGIMFEYYRDGENREQDG